MSYDVFKIAFDADVIPVSVGFGANMVPEEAEEPGNNKIDVTGADLVLVMVPGDALRLVPGSIVEVDGELLKFPFKQFSADANYMFAFDRHGAQTFLSPALGYEDDFASLTVSPWAMPKNVKRKINKWIVWK